MVWGVKQNVRRFFIISSVSSVCSLETVRACERVRSVRCPARAAHSRPCGAPALTSKASLDSERCDVMKREARSSRWDAGAQQASAHRELTTTMTTSWYLYQKFIRTLCTFVLRQHCFLLCSVWCYDCWRDEFITTPRRFAEVEICSWDPVVPVDSVWLLQSGCGASFSFSWTQWIIIRILGSASSACWGLLVSALNMHEKFECFKGEWASLRFKLIFDWFSFFYIFSAFVCISNPHLMLSWINSIKYILTCE